MKWEYEKACKEAGIDEQRIKEIRKIFEAEKQKRRQNKKAREKTGYQEVSMQALLEAGISVPALSAANIDIEEESLRQLALAYLNLFLKRFSRKEQYILLSWGVLPDREVAKRLGMKKSTMQDQRKRLIHDLQEFFKEETDLL